MIPEMRARVWSQQPLLFSVEAAIRHLKKDSSWGNDLHIIFVTVDLSSVQELDLQDFQHYTNLMVLYVQCCII